MGSTKTTNGHIPGRVGGRRVRSADGADLGRVTLARGRFVNVESTPTNAYWLRVDDLTPDKDGDLVAQFPAEALAGYLTAEPTMDGSERGPSTDDMVGTAEQTFPLDLAGDSVEETGGLLRKLAGKRTLALAATGGLGLLTYAGVMRQRARREAAAREGAKAAAQGIGRTLRDRLAGRG